MKAHSRKHTREGKPVKRRSHLFRAKPAPPSPARTGPKTGRGNSPKQSASRQSETIDPARDRTSPFDYIAHLDLLIGDIVANCPALGYVQTDRLVTAWSQSKVGGDHGVYATIHTLRFEGGSQTTVRGKHTYKWPLLLMGKREILYIVYFMLPRFVDLPFRSKLTTIFHELYHVNPLCNGDLRRFPGRNYAHGPSRESYNARLQPWISDYLERPESRPFTAFLEMDFAALCKSYPGVVGRRIRAPRAVRVAGAP